MGKSSALLRGVATCAVAGGGTPGSGTGTGAPVVTGSIVVVYEVKKGVFGGRVEM